MRWIGFWLIPTAFLVMLLANSSPVRAGGNCQDKLVGKTFNCTFTDNEGQTGAECLAFSTGGTSSDFDAVYDGTVDLGCVCDAKGSVASARFDVSSDTYQCARTTLGPASLSGKVKGKKITNQFMLPEGYQLVEVCTLASTPCN